MTCNVALTFKKNSANTNIISGDYPTSVCMSHNGHKSRTDFIPHDLRVKL